MGDRRQPFSFRFWSSAAPPPRRTPEPQTTAKPPQTTSPQTKTTTSPPTPKESISSPSTPPKTEIQTNGKGPKPQPKTTAKLPQTSPQNKTTITTSTSPPTPKESINSPSTPPKTEIQTNGKGPVTSQPSINEQKAGQQANAPTLHSPPKPQAKTTGQSISKTPPSTTKINSPSTPSNTKTQMDDQKTNNASIGPLDEPQTTSPSRATSQTKSAQPRSPPQPSSPSRAPPQAPTSSPSRMSSQIPSTPPRTPPSHVASRSPKQTSLPFTKGTPPSNESQILAKEIFNPNGDSTFVPNEKGKKPASSQQEPPLTGVDDPKIGILDGTRIKPHEMEVMPSKVSEQGPTKNVDQDPKTRTPVQKLGLSTIKAEYNPQTELNPKLPKIKAVGIKVNELAKKEANDFLTPKSVSEEQTMEETLGPSKQALEKKEIAPSSLHDIRRTNGSASQTKKRSMTSDTREQSALQKGEHVSMNNDIRSDISTLLNKVANGDNNSTNYERPLSVITLTGENRGASMQMGSNFSRKEGGPVHIHRSYRLNSDESPEVTSDGEGRSKSNKSEEVKSGEDQMKEACVNNNAQGINNSIVFKSSISERDPGVHLVINHVPKELFESIYKSRTIQTRKAEFNTTTADKHTYDPKVRRRCLRGLFLEPSDSDPENPEKSRRHGCLVGFKERGKENSKDVL